MKNVIKNTANSRLAEDTIQVFDKTKNEREKKSTKRDFTVMDNAWNQPNRKKCSSAKDEVVSAFCLWKTVDRKRSKWGNDEKQFANDHLNRSS